MPLTPPSASAPIPAAAGRRLPSHMQSVWVLARADLGAIAGSWLCRGFLIASTLLALLTLKGMQAEQKVASQMLEALYSSYVVLWMHAVVFIAGAALSREQDCLNDAILSRGVTRTEYLTAKLLARTGALLGMIALVLVPCSFWAVRQDKLVRQEGGYVTSNARNTQVEAWEPRKVFAGADGALLEMKLEVGDQVQVGDVLAQLDDRFLFDQLETERRAEENARNEVSNAQRREEDARRAVAQAEDALARSERALIGKDLLSKLEQADRETEMRSRKRDLQNTQNQQRVALEAVRTAERLVENAQARVRDARQRLGRATITAPISGYVTEVLVQSAQHVGLGTHLFTIAPLDEFQVRVPIYSFGEFKRLRQGLKAYLKIESTEYTGTIDRLGATAQDDRWGRKSNYVLVRFQGHGTLGLLGQNVDVRLMLPPAESRTNRVTALYNALTGQGSDDLESRTASVTPRWMLLGFGKVMGCAALLVTLTVLLLVLVRNQLIAILGAIGLWHVSNLLFDFAGLPDLSYLEIVRTMDKVLGGVAHAGHELGLIGWLFGLALAFALLALASFVSRDPPK
jgi:multidrug efflux pump subunit AcrA (membrane-fusion protein)